MSEEKYYNKIMKQDKMSLKEAENIIDEMYQDKYKIIEENNTIYVDRLDEVKFTNLEFASVRMLREVQSLRRKLEKLQKENEELRKGQNSLMQSRKKWKDRYYKLKAKSKKIIDLMAQNIELQQFANIDTTDIDLICKRLHCNKKCRLVSKECIKKYFKRIIRRCFK